jgi:peptide/nickel transport system substrate-binding protein
LTIFVSIQRILLRRFRKEVMMSADADLALAPISRFSVSRRTLLQTVSGTAAGLALTGTAKTLRKASAQDATPVAGGSLNVALYGEPTALNFQTMTGIPSYQVTRSIFDPLARWDSSTGELTPYLATAWSQESETAWVFTLREGVQFHKGYGEVTAEDVAFSYNNIIENKLAQNWAMSFITNVEAVDTYSVRFNLSAPYAAFPIVSISGPIGILSKKAYDELGGDVFARQPVGAGPFELNEWVAGDRIALKKFDQYWQDGQPYLDELIFRIVPDPFIRQSLLLSGEVDFTDIPDYREVGAIQEAEGMAIQVSDGWGWDYLSFNTTVAPTDNKLVRQAISYAIDRQELVDTIYFGYAAPADQPIPTTFPAGKPDLLWRYPATADQEKAKALLAEAGAADGVKLSVITYDAEHLRRELQIIGEQLRQVGIELEITQADRPTYNEAVNNIGAGMPYNAEFGYISLIGADEDTALYWFQHKDTLRWHGWDDTEKDDLLDQARISQDRAERTELYTRVLDKMLEDQAFIYVNHPNVVRAMRSRVQGFVVTPRDWETNFHEVWLAES